MFKDKNIDWRKVSISFGAVMLLQVMVMGGMAMNFLALQHNGGRMPFVADYEYQDNTHFSYQSDLKVKYPLLTDKIRLFNHIWSIGDFVMLFGITGLILNAVILFKRGIKKR